MTQLHIQSIETGWGESLKLDLASAQGVLREADLLEQSLQLSKNHLSRAMGRLNTARRKRVVDLLEKEQRGICLLHTFVFPESAIEESLVPVKEISIVRMRKSWETRHGYDDSTPSYTQHSSEYDSVACKHCRQVVSHGNFLSKEKDCVHTLSHSPATATKVAELDTPMMIDLISEQYYRMPVVTLENLASLEF